MARTNFFMTRDDIADFVSFLIERFAAEFVPERSLNPPPFPRYPNLTEVMARVDEDVEASRYSRFAVLSHRWEQFPLVIDEVNANDGQHFFSVQLTYGGPAFDLIVPRTWTCDIPLPGEGLLIVQDGQSSVERDGPERRWIVAGSFGDYPYYVVDTSFIKDPSLYKPFKRPAVMVAAYKAVKEYLRRHGCRSECRETGQIGPWILRGALRQWESGMWLRGGDWHYQPRGRSSNARRTK